MRRLSIIVPLLGLILSLSTMGGDITINQLSSDNGVSHDAFYIKQIIKDKSSFSPLLYIDIDKQLENLNTYKLPEDTINYRLELQKLIASYHEPYSGVENIFNKQTDSTENRIFDQSIGILQIIPTSHPQFILMSPCEFKSSEGENYIQQTPFDPEHPYLIAIDNLPIAYWIHKLEPYISSTNKGRIYQESAHWLEHINQARKIIGKTLSNEARLTLASKAGETTDHFVTLNDDIYACPKDHGYHVQFVDIQPDSDKVTALEDSDIAYVPLPEMYNAAKSDTASKLFMLIQQIVSASGKKGMILDLRDNNRGNRTALIALYPFLAYQDSLPRVVNVMSYRLPEDDPIPWGSPDSHKLTRLFAFRSDNDIWSEPEQLSIEAFETAGFQSDISSISPVPPANWYNSQDFSRWHYMVMSPRQQFFRNMVQEYEVVTPVDASIIDNLSDLVNHWDDLLPLYIRPEHIVVLTNQSSYGAAENLLSAIKGMDGITIMGSRSGGGNTSTHTYELPCGTQIKLGSTLSFTPQGKLYDNDGIEPDLRVMPQINDFFFRQYLNTNKPQIVQVEDSLLKEAIRFIKTSEFTIRTLEAGPIYGDDDAEEKCAMLCETRDGSWNHQWWTTRPGEMSVCQCRFPAELTEDNPEPERQDPSSKGWFDPEPDRIKYYLNAQ